MEKFFNLKEHGTNVKTEIFAGITTFMTMAYILAVNPGMLSIIDGVEFGPIFTATAVASIVATLVMALYAKLPFALAPGMGLNAFFVFSVCLGMGKSFEFALTAVLLEGLIFIVLTLFNIREAIINAIPMNIKKAISVGIGLFIAFIGLNNAGIIIQGNGIPLDLGTITSAGPILTIIGLFVTGILLAHKVNGALFFGILITTAIGFPLGLTALPEGLVAMPDAPYVFKFVGPSEIMSFEMVLVLFTFLFVDMFDTVGTLVGVSTKAKMLTPDGKVPNAKKALFADAVGTTVGACLGTSTVTTFVESAAGVAEGGRSGLTSLVTAIMFTIALFFAPLFGIIPAQATAPALIIVGLFMMSPIKEIEFDDITEALPAFLTIIMMPLAYSIADGIAFGVLSYVVLKICSGRMKDITALTVVIAILSFLALTQEYLYSLLG